MLLLLFFVLGMKGLCYNSVEVLTMYKIVALDLDETLLDLNKNCCERNLKAIAEAQKLGVKIVPSSGRTPGFLGTTLEDLNINKENEYCILGNGAIVVDNKTNETIFCAPIPFDVITQLFDFGKEKGVGIQIFTPENVYFWYTSDEEWNHICHLGNNLVRRHDDSCEDLKDKTIIKILYQRKDMLFLKQLEKELEPITKNKITTSFSSGRYLELNQFGIHKGVGLKALSDHLGVDIKDTIGIGDNYNDMELIRHAGLGCAVANAIDEVKEIATYVCESDCAQGGVAEVIENFILKPTN